ncbi:hypothetical protein G2W53_027090 [Senna tora]|uniref:Uncharacterized protein n=1 Tax=Senna tora TaxID=362788 RepID=A0A834TIN8_9FABA|nr:hypothetical protein G2W53_027090 [Senna tora]
MPQGSLPRSVKAIRVGRPAVDHMDRRPSKINESWVNIISMQNLTFICWVKMKPITQVNLLRSFKAIRHARGQIFDARRRGSPLVGNAQNSITHGSTFFSIKNHTCICSDKMIPMTQGSLPRSFKAIRVGSPAVDHMDHRPSKINVSWVNVFSYAKSQVHMIGQNEPYDTRKSPKKFQGNPTCARPNLRWKTTWIAVSRRLSKINPPWVRVLGRNEAYNTSKPPKKIQGNPTCVRPNLRWTTTWIGVGKMIHITQGSLPRSFKAIRVRRPAVDLVDRRPSKINESWVHMPRQNKAYDTRKPPKKFQGNPTCAGPNLRWTTTWMAVGRRRSKINHPWETAQEVSGQSDLRTAKYSMDDDVNSRRNPPKKFQGDPSRSPGGGPGGSPSIKNKRVVGQLFSKENLTSICRVKMKPMTQGNLPRSFKAIRLARGRIFVGRRRGSLSVGNAQKSITHGSNFFYAKYCEHLTLTG